MVITQTPVGEKKKKEKKSKEKIVRGLLILDTPESAKSLIKRIEQRVEIKSTAAERTLRIKSSKMLDKQGEQGRQG